MADYRLPVGLMFILPVSLIYPIYLCYKKAGHFQKYLFIIYFSFNFYRFVCIVHAGHFSCLLILFNAKNHNLRAMPA